MDDTKPTPTPTDTLIAIAKIETKLDFLTDEVKKGNDDTKERLVLLTANKLEKEEFHQWQITHEKKTSLREMALQKQIEESYASAMKIAKDHTNKIADLEKSDATQSKQLQYIAGGLVVFGVIISIVGPLVTSWIGHLLHLN